MPRSSTERGKRHPYNARYGLSIGTAKGIFKQPDPGAIPDEALQDGINIRLTNGGSLGDRGGQEKAIDTGLTGCIFGMIDVPTPEGLYLATEFVLDTYLYLGVAGSGDLAHIFEQQYFDELANVGNCAVYSTAPRRNAFIFDDKIYFVGTPNAFATPPEDTATNIYEIVKDLDGIDREKYSKKLTFTMPEKPSTFAITTGLRSDGAVGEILYIGSVASPTGKVYAWDGKSLIVAYETGAVSKRQIVVSALNDIYIFWEGSGVRLHDGVGTTITGMSADAIPSCAIEYLDKLVVGTSVAAGGELVFVGELTTSVETIHTLDGGVGDLAVFDGALCYGYTGAGFEGVSAYIGNYDGTTFDDTAIVLAGGSEGTASVSALLTGDRCLFVACQMAPAEFAPNNIAVLLGITDVFTHATIYGDSPEVLLNDETLTSYPTLVMP